MPEAPLLSTDEPDRLPLLLASPPLLNDVLPTVRIPPVPTNELRPYIDAEDAGQFIEVIAAGNFSKANPRFYEWMHQRPGAETRHAVLARQSARLVQLLDRTSFLKTVASGKEPDF